MGSLSPQDFRLVRSTDDAPLPGKAEKKMMKMVTADNDAAYGNDVAGPHASSEAGDGFTRIGELAKTYDVTLRTLRFYEDKGLLNPQARRHHAALYAS